MDVMNEAPENYKRLLDAARKRQRRNALYPGALAGCGRRPQPEFTAVVVHRPCRVDKGRNSQGSARPKQ